MSEIRGVEPPTREDEVREAEAMLEIANKITAELPALTSPHWHLAASQLRDALAEAVARRPRPRFQRIDGGQG